MERYQTLQKCQEQECLGQNKQTGNKTRCAKRGVTEKTWVVWPEKRPLVFLVVGPLSFVSFQRVSQSASFSAVPNLLDPPVRNV